MASGFLQMKKNAMLWFAVAVLLALVPFVQPIREAPVDDDWAYVWTVKHLVETGQYQLHDWLAANIPFQAYWGAAFCHVFGFSFGILRISVLVLTLLGVFAFFGLAREHGLNRNLAGMLVLVLAGSPLVMRYSYSFMSDVPFLATLLLSLFLYTRAIRRQSFSWMLFASAAGASAILVRQFGVALIAGLFALWCVDKKCRRRPLFFIAGMLLPILAAAWQVNRGMLSPNWAAKCAKIIQSNFLHDSPRLLSAFLWRPGIIFHYLALFCSPLVFMAVVASCENALRGKPRLIRVCSAAALGMVALGAALVAATILWTCFAPIPGHVGTWIRVLSLVILLIAAGVWSRHVLRNPDQWPPFRVRKGSSRARAAVTYAFLTAYILCATANSASWLLPYIPWSFRNLGLNRYPLSLMTFVGSILFARQFLLRYLSKWRELPASRKLLDTTSFFLLCAHLAFYKLGDEYLLDLIPIALIVMGLSLKHYCARYRYAFVLLSLGIVLMTANSTRWQLARSEVYWRLSENLRSRGVEAKDISSSWEWLCYYRFQEYISSPGGSHMDNLFNVWLPEQAKNAKYLVILGTQPPPRQGEWETVETTTYPDFFFRKRLVKTIHKGGP